MILDKNSAEDFAYACHDRLAKKLGISSGVPLVVDVKDIGERPKYVRETIPRLFKEMTTDDSNIREAFNIPSVDNASSLTFCAISAAMSTACYDPKNHTITATVYPDVDSLARFCSEMKMGLDKNSYATVENNSNSLPGAIAECVGMALRSEAINHARSKLNPDYIIVAEKGGLFGGSKRMLFEYDKINSQKCRKFLRKTGYRPKETLRVGAFFSPIGVLEGSEEFKGTKYAFVLPKDYQEVGRRLEEAKRDGSTFLTKKSSPDAVDKIQRARLASTALTCMMRYNQNPEAFRENFVYSQKDPIMKWPAKRIISDFFIKEFEDFDDRLDALPDM